jgi:hypothetical protein
MDGRAEAEATKGKNAVGYHKIRANNQWAHVIAFVYRKLKETAWAKKVTGLWSEEGVGFGGGRFAAFNVAAYTHTLQGENIIL